MKRLTATQKLAIKWYRVHGTDFHNQFSRRTWFIAKNIVRMGINDRQRFLPVKTDTQYYNAMIDMFDEFDDLVGLMDNE